MAEAQVVWPTGMTDREPNSTPLVFNPHGFLVAILDNAYHAERAKAALKTAGFADGDLRVHTSQEILDSREQFLAQRSLTGRVVSALTDDQETVNIYYGYAREGRSALWVHVPDDQDADRAIRCLADHHVLHIRHYGHGSLEDLHIH